MGGGLGLASFCANVCCHANGVSSVQVNIRGGGLIHLGLDVTSVVVQNVHRYQLLGSGMLQLGLACTQDFLNVGSGFHDVGGCFHDVGGCFHDVGGCFHDV